MNDTVPGRGHNRPQPRRRHDFALESAPMRSLLEQFMFMRSRAISECNRELRHYIDSMGPWRFSPSRLKKWPTGRSLLVRKFLSVWDVAIGKRLGQLNSLNRKLTRGTTEWPLLTDEEMTQPPAYWGHYSYASETVRFPLEDRS